MKTRIALAVAVCLASASIALASPKRITDFADHEFGAADIVSALAYRTRGPNELLDETHPQSPANRRVQLAVAG